MRIAQINGCNVCLQWRFPEMADRGVTEELYEHVEDPANGNYSEQELLAIEYADKFALDHRSLDDAFFTRLRAAFTDAEIVELTAMIGNWLAFGRFQAVLDVAEACAWAPPTETATPPSPPLPPSPSTRRWVSDGAHRTSR